MNAKRALFVAEYLIDLNATRAAIRAGYSAKTARTIGSQLLTNVDIQAAVAEQQGRQLADVGVTAQRVKAEIARLAFSDIRGLFDEHGNLRPMSDLTDAQAASVAGLEVIIKNVAAGDKHTDTIHKVKVWDKPKALEMLAKHFGLLDERVHHDGDLTIRWQTS